MRHVDTTPAGRAGVAGSGRARALALVAIAVLAAGALLLAVAWSIGGQDAISDNLVGATAAIALVVGLVGSLAAAVMGVADLARYGTPPRSWLPLLTFPTALAVLLLLELLVLE